MTTIRAALLGFSTVVGLSASGCSHAPGKVMGDTMTFDGTQKKWVPLIEYKAPDIDEITGIDSDSEPPTPPTPGEPPPAATPAPAAEATPPAATPPAAPAKGTPAATPAKTPPPAKK